MFKLGEYQELKVAKEVTFGMYLVESEQERPGVNNESERGEVLLPKKLVPDGTKVGDVINVFLYKDSQDRLIATTLEPKITMGQIVVLPVAQVNKMGAFLKWGLEKDLFLPFREQTKKVREGEEVLVTLYIDKSQRLCATMNVYKELSCESPYKAGDDVSGIIYESSDQFGLFVAVDNRYSAIIPKREVYGELEIGQKIRARVTKVRDDGKMNLTVREKASVQMYPDMEKIMELLESYSGVLPFTEKATPEVIKRETGMSKAEFKRAIGHLYKERKITITDGKIRKNV